MRILAVIPGTGDGSGMVFARRQVEQLRKMGVDVATLYMGGGHLSTTAFRNIARLRSMAREFKPDLVHVHYGSGSAALVSVASPIPFIMTLRGSDISKSSSMSKFRRTITRQLSKFAANRAAGVICVSANLVRDLGPVRAPTVIIPTGVDTDAFQPVEQSAARAKLGWGPNEPVVAFNCTGDPVVKGMRLATATMERVRQAVPSAQFHVLNGTIPPSEVPVVLNAADCLLVTSISEGSPTIVQESLACNLPVVSVDVGDVAKVTRGGSPGGIAPRDPQALADLVIPILQNRARSNGRSIAATLSLEATGRQVIEFCENLLTRIRPNAIHPGK